MDERIKPLLQAAQGAEQQAAQGEWSGVSELLPRLSGAGLAAAPLAERLSLLAERAGQFELALRFFQCFHRLSQAEPGGLTERSTLEARWPALQAAGRPLCLALLEPDQSTSDPTRQDPVLLQLVQLQRNQCRAHDLTLRQGPQQLLLVLLDIELAAARNACERVRRAVKAHDWAAFGVEGLSVSIGFTALRGGESLDRLQARAEAGLLAARREGRNCVRAGLLAD
ncbi:GGDEF domain-containing protein [Pelomonas sp. SE-A7]|uniref:GGDEF domain-containing protein n=1 Tax=Pelomonas sp. SE-A7 TaxID=3054953 RepID=UPI00259D240F|nr:GGDEF domain-containing protein [Pelomonas sp. SE-A7]MDM4767758.1 GGDEF domain-containing protein [Pelomonas sp. SE-A7]